MAKKEVFDIIWSMDIFGDEYDHSSNIPLFEIYKDRRTFVILYHGCCAIHRSNSIEEAIEYCRSKSQF